MSTVPDILWEGKPSHWLNFIHWLMAFLIALLVIPASVLIDFAPPQVIAFKVALNGVLLIVPLVIVFWRYLVVRGHLHLDPG